MKDYTEAERLQAAERMCPLGLTWCADVSKYYRARGELSRARDFAERTCQYGDRSYCRELGKKYLKGVFQEPVRGRGEALLTWGCDSLISMEYDDVCKARAAKQRGRTSKAP